MPDEKTKKAVFRWSVFLALIHLVLLIYFYGMNVPKVAVYFPVDYKNTIPLFEFTRWFDPLAWPIFGAFVLFVSLPVKNWMEGNKERVGDDFRLHEVFSMGFKTFCMGTSMCFPLFGLILSISEGIVTGLLNGAAAGLLAGGSTALIVWAIFFFVWVCIKTFPVLQRFRTDNSFIERCIKPFEKLFSFLNAEE
jgi:hypothetical protein